ncbi:PorV/PorQ family protein [Melioribacteraceae bacterium 4301-Me]|uniref:PorV/PorQ family protein n=1 Tax=Pyranulibacter aquaticus TaxID=3163344 RepID=UPI003597534E
MKYNFRLTSEVLMKTNNLILLVVLIVFQSIMNAQTVKTGTTAAQVLKIGVGGRATAMGGAYTAVADDITSMYWNPGGLASLKSNEAYFNHALLYADIGFDYASFASNIEGFGTLGASVTVLSVDEMPVRTIERPQGTGEFFDVGSMVIGLSYARYLTDNFSIGFNAKYIREFIYNMSSTGFAVDVGTIYRIPILNELRIAASISNFGTKMRLEGRDAIVITRSGAGGDNLINSHLELDEFDLPLLFRFGLSSDIIKHNDSRLTLAVDAVHPNDHTEYINSGAEFAWNESVFIRAGWNALFERDSEKGLTLGIGFNYRLANYITFIFDYAYEDYGRLTEVHFFSAGIKF